MRIQSETKGFTAIFGQEINRLFRNARSQLGISERLFWPPHVTLLKNSEAKSLSPALGRRATSFPVKSVLRDLHVVGVGGYPDRGVLYLVVLCPSANQHRLSLGLPPKDLHITLTPKDDQELPKGIDTLLRPVDWAQSQFPVLQAYIQHLLLLQAQEQAQQLALTLCDNHRSRPRSWITLAEVLLHRSGSSETTARMRGQKALAALSLARASHKNINPRHVSEIKKQARHLSCSTADLEQLHQALMQEISPAETGPALSQELGTPWSQPLLQALAGPG